MAYATLADFYRYGLRAAALTPQARTVVSVNAAGDALFVPVHGMATADPLRVGVGVNGALPAPLSSSAVYYAIAVDGDTFKLATSAANATGGIAIDLTSAGSGAITVIASLEPMILGQLDNDAARIDRALKAYGTPLPAPFPLEVVQVNCWLSARNVAATMAMLNPAQPTQDIDLVAARYQDAQKILAAWESGNLLPAGTIDATVDVLENGTVFDTDPDFECLELN